MNCTVIVHLHRLKLILALNLHALSHVIQLSSWDAASTELLRLRGASPHQLELPFLHLRQVAHPPLLISRFFSHSGLTIDPHRMKTFYAKWVVHLLSPILLCLLHYFPSKLFAKDALFVVSMKAKALLLDAWLYRLCRVMTEPRLPGLIVIAVHTLMTVLVLSG